jgi:uncharacterized protein YndB with AHSA1/START domain/DNA-binding transcriptional ArsR family regulator
MESIFKALGDETRRQLLDMLRLKDGQTLTELEGALGMTRFGVMKHLKILESATLIVTRKSGRFKYHYLNAAPLQLLVDRWIEPLTQQPLARAILDLKSDLERNPAMTTMTETKPDFVLETFIRTTPEKLWDALTNAALIPAYHFAGTRVEGAFTPGTDYRYLVPNGNVILSGTVIAAAPPHRLEMTFRPGWMGPDAKESRHVYEIEAVGDLMKLTVLHFDLPTDQLGVREGWAKFAASLKSFLETGTGLKFG